MIMSDDSFTEVTNESWFSRIGNSIKGIIFGIILFLVAFPVLFMNEGRAVRTYKTLKEGAGKVVTIDSESVDAANEGKLVHLTGKATTVETLSDSQFGVSADAIKLRRNVEMYQWKEKKTTSSKKKVGGSKETKTTYDYFKTWSKTPIKSSSFKKLSGHENPQTMAYSKNEHIAEDVTLGDFKLSKSLISKLNAYKNLPIAETAKIPESLSGKVKIYAGGYYYGSDPASPSVGDLKISFEVIKPLDVSVISQQIGSTFEPFLSKTGKKLEMITAGTVSAESMFEQAKKNNAMMTWILRAVGFILMFVGITLVFKPLAVVADVLPILGNLVGAASGFVAALIAGLFSLVTIAIAWIVFRPLLGIILLVVAGGIVYQIKVVISKKKKAA
jgi:hypothetical protein